MTAYYNEFDPKAAAWLREIIKRNLIAPGEVDERSIKDVQSDDLKGFTQCHFFAGIGGWSYALRLAGIADDVPVWSGSCPCQPFSNAGKRKGTADERHLWPEFYRLIQERNPSTVFGEQVAGQAGVNWLTGVFGDMEAIGYSAAGADLCAAGIGAPHVRQRLYWVAHAGRITAGSEQEPRDAKAAGQRLYFAGRSSAGGMGYADDKRLEGRQLLESKRTGKGIARATSSWDQANTITCGDGKQRRIEPSISPLATGIPARVVRLRGYGNAIIPALAAEFIQASIEAIQEVG